MSKPKAKPFVKKIPDYIAHDIPPTIPNDPRLRYLNQNENIVFSFEILQLDHEYFNFGGTCENWFQTAFSIMNMLSREVTPERLRLEFSRESSPLRFHLHIQGRTEFWPNLKDGIMEQGEFCQIRFGKSFGGIHGILIENVFFIVWFDPHHNMYPDEKYGGLKKFNTPKECCNYRDRELLSMHQEITRLNNDVQDLMNLLDTATSTPK